MCSVGLLSRRGAETLEDLLNYIFKFKPGGGLCFDLNGNEEQELSRF